MLPMSTSDRELLKLSMWGGAIKVVSTFLCVTVALLAVSLFFPRDLLPYKCTTIHKIHMEKLKI